MGEGKGEGGDDEVLGETGNPRHTVGDMDSSSVASSVASQLLENDAFVKTLASKLGLRVEDLRKTGGQREGAANTKTKSPGLAGTIPGSLSMSASGLGDTSISSFGADSVVGQSMLSGCTAGSTITVDEHWTKVRGNNNAHTGSVGPMGSMEEVGSGDEYDSFEGDLFTSDEDGDDASDDEMGVTGGELLCKISTSAVDHVFSLLVV